MKIVVIGAGISGLAAATLMAKDGHTVTILEKNNTIGGRARIFKEKGFTFDMGPSWYMMPEVFERFFNQCGSSVKAHYKLKQLEPKYTALWEDGTAVTVKDEQNKNWAFFEKIEPGSSTKVQKLLSKTTQAYSIATKLLYIPITNLASLFTIQIIQEGLKLLFLYNQFESYHRFIARYVNSTKLQQLLEFHTVFLGGTPKNTPALYSLLTAADWSKKIWYPMGGMGQIILGLKNLAKKNKVTIKTNSEVRAIIVKNGRATAVELVNNSKIECDLIINSSDYAHSDQNIVPTKYREYSKKYWQTRTYTVSTLLLYLGLDSKIPQLSHHTFYFQNDWNEHLNQTFIKKELPKNPCYYICTPSKSDPTVAPKGMENLFVLIPIGVDNPDASHKKYVDHVISHIEKTLKTPLKKHILVKKVYAQKDFALDYNAYKGNAFGIAHTLDQSIFLRPRMRSKKITNLWFTGHYTQPGVGMPMAVISAQLVHQLITKAIKNNAV